MACGTNAAASGRARSRRAAWDIIAGKLVRAASLSFQEFKASQDGSTPSSSGPSELGARASDSTALDGAEHPIRGGVPARRRARARHLAPARARVREQQLRRRLARGRGRRARARGAHGEFERAARGRARALRARAPAPLGGRGRRRARALVAAAAKGGRQTGRHVGGGHSALPRHRHALREHLRRHAAAARVGHRRYGLAPHRLSVQGP